MALAQEDIAFIKAHLSEWLTEQSLGDPRPVDKQPAPSRMLAGAAAATRPRTPNPRDHQNVTCLGVCRVFKFQR